MKLPTRARGICAFVALVLTGAMLGGWLGGWGERISSRIGLATAAEAAAGPQDLFAPVAEVLRNPRCMNCHPRGDRPRQDDDRHLHLQNVVRGVDGMGFVNARCTACHRAENNAYSGVPGAPNWHLAPLSMGWEGLDDAALCTTLKDEKLNGGKTVAALVEHLEKDALVLWGWAPGADRKPVTPPHPEFMTKVKAWASAGAPCPQPK